MFRTRYKIQFSFKTKKNFIRNFFFFHIIEPNKISANFFAAFRNNKINLWDIWNIFVCVEIQRGKFLFKKTLRNPISVFHRIPLNSYSGQSTFKSQKATERTTKGFKNYKLTQIGWNFNVWNNNKRVRKKAINQPLKQ